MRLRVMGILAVLAMMFALAVSSVSAGVEVTYADITGYAEGTSDNNHPETWGEDCTKIDGDQESNTYLLPALEEGLVYDQVIVKAGSDESTDGHANTIFDNPAAGETVFADSNGSGAFDEGDKIISHIIICTAVATPTLSLEKVVTGTGASGTFAFSFTADGGAAFDVTADDAPKEVAATSGSHMIAEGILLANWSLTSVSCDSDAVPTVDLGARTVTVTVGADEDVTCTFTNNLTTTTTTTTPPTTPPGGGTLGGNPTPTPRAGTQGGVPNTAMESGPADQVPVALLALLALGSLGYVAQRNIVAMKDRR